MIKILNSFFSEGNKRTILAKKNIFISFFIKAIGMIVVFTMVPISIKYLGKENYGVWIVLSGLITWSNVFDLGFSHGLRNRLAEAKANNNLKDGKYYVSTTYAFLFLIAFLMIIIFVPLFSYMDWQGILNTKVISNEIIRLIVFIIFSFFLLQFILKPINSILEAYQWPVVVQALSLLGSVVGLLGVICLIFAGENSFSLYVYIIAGAPVLVLALASIYLYRQKFLKLIPSFKYVRKKYFKRIASLGLSFFIIQLSVLVIFQSDNMIISYLFGPEEVTNYNIVYRYFSIVITIFGVIMAPFWTAFTDAYQNKDFIWIQKTMRILLFLVAGSAVLSILLFFISDNIYHLWINESIVIPKLTSGLMSIYVVLLGIINIYAFFSNGTGKVRIQLIINTIAAVINIPLSYLLGFVLGMGVAGVLLATIISMTVIGIMLIIQYIKIISNTASGVWNE